MPGPITPQPQSEASGDMAGFCPACLRWAVPLAPDESSRADGSSRDDDSSRDIACARCGAGAQERFVALLARAVHRAGQESGRHVVAIRLSDQLVAALTVAGIDVVRAADHRGASPNLDGAASLVLWVPPPDSSQDISAGLSQVARLLSPEGAALVVTDTTPDNVQGAFAAANLQAQRVAAGHLLPGPALRLTGIERDTATWSLSLSPDGGATTAELSERVEAQLFAALAVGGMRLELDLDHHAAVASVWERAYIVTRRRRALQAADAARSLARRLGGHPPRLSSVRLPSESVPPTIDADGARWIGGGVAEPNPRPAAVAANLRKADDIPAVSAGADALLRCRLGARAPQLRLVLHEFNDDRVFAGIRTALKAAVSLARTVDLPLTVMLLREPAERRSIGTLIDWFRTDVDDQEFVDRVQVTSIEREPGVDVHVDDVWMLTYWTTAVAASRAARAGIIDARRAVYLVQDYEPGFFGWSDESAMAITTYQQGFHHLVNSSPLARYLEDQEGVLVPPDQVFAPVVEVDRFERAAEAWRPDPAGRLRVLFYGRPRHPRNLFRIGLESLRLWIETLDGDERPQVQSAGADHPPYRLAPDVFLQPLGKLSFDEYVELLSRTDLALALMFSPHPGHLSLEPPAAGIPTVTNRFGTYREAWLSGLAVADPDPQALALALGEAARSARGLEVHRTERLPASLGASLDDAIRAVASRL